MADPLAIGNVVSSFDDDESHSPSSSSTSQTRPQGGDTTETDHVPPDSSDTQEGGGFGFRGAAAAQASTAFPSKFSPTTSPTSLATSPTTSPTSGPLTITTAPKLTSSAITLLSEIRDIYRAAAIPMLEEEQRRLRFLPFVQALFTFYTLGLAVWRLVQFVNSNSSTGDNEPCLIAALVLSAVSAVTVVRDQALPLLTRQHRVPLHKRGSLASGPGEWVRAIRRMAERRSLITHSMVLCNLFASVGFAMLRLGCSYSSFAGSYFTDYIVIYLLDLPWVVYMSYSIFLGDASFSSSGIILNNLDLYHTSFKLTNEQAYHAVQVFMFLNTVYYDPIYSRVLGVNESLQRVLDLAMLTSNIVIRATIDPSAFSTVTSINAVFMVVSAMQVVGLNPIAVLRTAHLTLLESVSTPLRSLLYFAVNIVTTVRDLFTCCCRSNRHGEGGGGSGLVCPCFKKRSVGNRPITPTGRNSLSAVAVVVHSQSAAPTASTPAAAAATANTAAAVASGSPSGSGDSNGQLRALVAAGSANQGGNSTAAGNQAAAAPLPPPPPPPVAFLLRKMQEMLNTCTRDPNGQMTLVEFICFCNALSVSADTIASWNVAQTGVSGGWGCGGVNTLRKRARRDDAAVAAAAAAAVTATPGKSIDVQAFGLVHDFFVHHILSGTTADDFFEFDYY